ncbi:MAG: winged helix-turn-helix transcriptional regulator [Lactimicrobium massiliense]
MGLAEGNHMIGRMQRIAFILIHREVYPVVPPKTEYSLTERGKTLKKVVYSLCEWGRENMSRTF